MTSCFFVLEKHWNHSVHAKYVTPNQMIVSQRSCFSSALTGNTLSWTKSIWSPLHSMVCQAQFRNPLIVLEVGLFVSFYSHAREHAMNYWNYRTDKATKNISNRKVYQLYQRPRRTITRVKGMLNLENRFCWR